MSSLLILSLSFLLTVSPTQNVFLYKERAINLQQQGQGILYIDKLPPSELFATAGKGNSTLEEYDDSIEARERRSKESYFAFIEIVGTKK